MNSNNKRESGILLHLTSLPSDFGIGDLGPGAYYFVDLLEKMGQKLWQILPTNPPSDDSYSPYSTDSAFANNTLLISLEELKKDGFLSDIDFIEYPTCSEIRLELDKILEPRLVLLEKAINNFWEKNKDNQRFKNFCDNNKYWLDNYAAFCCLSEKFRTKNWTLWDKKFRNFNEQVVHEFGKTNKIKINRVKIAQFFYHEQWQRLKDYSNKKGIKIIGDIPIYVSHHSADVWSNQNLFKLNGLGQMTKQSGCPPDLFDSNGQIWGHPIYDWEEHKKTNFKWWIDRIKHLDSMIDIIRIDHFNGFAKYWEIPAEDENGLNGSWIDSPGDDFFQLLFQKLKGCKIFAENLGEAAPYADPLLSKYNIPGMMILQFSFGNGLKEPNIKPDLVLYTGTHDNDTAVGWFNNISSRNSRDIRSNTLNETDCIKTILKSNGREINWDMIRYSFKSNAKTVIIPMQDLIGLGSSERMNVPGTVSKNNWTWRFRPNQLLKEKKERLLKLTIESER